MKNVAILTYDQAALFELGCATELFALPRPEFQDWYQTEIVTFDSLPINYVGGLTAQAKQIRDLLAYDLLVIPSWPVHKIANDDALINAIHKFHQSGNRIITFCSGAFLLAQLGLLDNRPATTHWRYADFFTDRFPKVTYKADVLYVYDGTIGCSAGSAAAIDLGLELIRQDYGHHIANQVARRLVLSAHRKGGQSQFADTPVEHENGQFSQTLNWASQHLSEAININELAAKANMTRRTFDRKFKANFNITAKAWLTHQRLDLAKSLLESGDLDMEHVAQKSGFNNATTMRHHFRQELGISPTRHKEMFKQETK